MKSYIFAALSIIFIVFAAYQLGTSMVHAVPPRNIDCTAELQIYSEQGSFAGVWKLHAAGGRGFFRVSGRYSHHPQVGGNLNRTVFFDYTRHQNMLDIVSKRIIPAITDNAQASELAGLLPRFLYSAATSHSFEIYPQANGYIITGTVLPFTYCLQA
ncbi:TPA: hypothetical protein ACG0BA_001591 [Serratia odorifera]